MEELKHTYYTTRPIDQQTAEIVVNQILAAAPNVRRIEFRPTEHNALPVCSFAIDYVEYDAGELAALVDPILKPFRY